MKRLFHNFLPVPPLTQRGDSGTIYIVFIMVIIIAASYVMVGGLKPEFDNDAAKEAAATETEFTEGPGGLPSLPPTDSPEYLKAKECADLVDREAKKFSKTDKPRVIEGC